MVAASAYVYTLVSRLTIMSNMLPVLNAAVLLGLLVAGCAGIATR
jgi:hypothetical protein